MQVIKAEMQFPDRVNTQRSQKNAENITHKQLFRVSCKIERHGLRNHNQCMP